MRERTGVPAWLKIQPELGIWVAKFGESGASDTSVLTQGFVKQRKEWHLRALCYRGSSGATVHGRGHSEPAPQPGTAQWDWDSDRLCTAQGLKEMFRYLPWDFGLNLWSLQLTALVSECLSILRDSKVGNYFLLTGSKTHCKLMMLTFFFFLRNSVLFWNKPENRNISLGHSPLAPPPAVLQLPGPGNFLSSRRKLLHTPVSTIKTITRPDHLCTECSSHYTALLKEFKVMKFSKMSQ